MTPQDKIRELEEFERRQRETKQAATRVSSVALAAAALILAAMIAVAWWQLRSIRAETALERQKQADSKPRMTSSRDATPSSRIRTTSAQGGSASAIRFWILPLLHPPQPPIPYPIGSTSRSSTTPTANLPPR